MPERTEKISSQEKGNGRVSTLNGADLSAAEGLRAYAIICRQRWLVSQLIEVQHDLAELVAVKCPEHARSIVENTKPNESAMKELSSAILDMEEDATRIRELLLRLIQDRGELGL
jgi:hypothetical protein